jgi:hypothetical protein
VAAVIQSLPAGKRSIVTPYRIVVSLLLAVAAAALYVGLVSSVDHKSEVADNQHIAALFPAPHGTALRQTRIVAQLKDGYTGTLIVEGIEIPDAQVEHLEGLDTVAFTPGPGTETGPLQPGKRCARVVYWPLTSSRADAAYYDWCWQVH